MARPRTPTSVLEARGAFVNHPERRADREHEPMPIAEMGPAPKYFSKEEKKIWKELQNIAAPGVLFNCDRWTAETVCILKAKERARTITNPERSQLIQIYSKLGMTRSDRSKVTARPQPKKTAEANPWDELSAQPVN